MDNNCYQEKVKPLSFSMNNKNYNNKDSRLINEDQLQKNAVKSLEHSNLKKINSDNINIFSDLSQLHENVSDNQNKELSGLC